MSDEAVDASKKLQHKDLLDSLIRKALRDQAGAIVQDETLADLKPMPRLSEELETHSPAGHVKARQALEQRAAV
jgi:hypothetical protein